MSLSVKSYCGAAAQPAFVFTTDRRTISSAVFEAGSVLQDAQGNSSAKSISKVFIRGMPSLWSSATRPPLDTTILSGREALRRLHAVTSNRTQGVSYNRKVSKYYVQNFGCRATQADGAALESLLNGKGMDAAEERAAADLVVLNT